MMIQILAPTTARMTSTVSIPAPALSLVVIGLVDWPGSVSASVPALGSLAEVPPVFAVNGAICEVIKFAPITLRADIWTMLVGSLVEKEHASHTCWPTPAVPSYSVVYQRLPHVLPFVPPMHWPAAPCAEAFSFGMICSAVKGARILVTAIHRDRYALKLL